MLPLFLRLGYSEDRFLGPSEPLCSEGLQIMADLEQMKAGFALPQGFMWEISRYLSYHGIKWKKVLDVADVVFKRHNSTGAAQRRLYQLLDGIICFAPGAPSSAVRSTK